MKNKFTFLGIIAVMLLSIISIHAYAQVPHITYTYDANGNRLTRQYSPNRIMNDTTPTDAEADKVAVQYGIGVYPNPLMDGSSVTVAIARNKTTE